MLPPDKAPSPVVPEKSDTAPHPPFQIPARFLLALIALVACFGRPLYELVRFSIHSDLYSHIGLVPFISLYLVWLNRRTLSFHSAPGHRLAVILLIAGTLSLASYWTVILTQPALALEDSLALTTLSFLLFFGGLCSLFLGKSTVRVLAFPLAFLIFMVPFPSAVRAMLETFLQHGSAAVAYALFRLFGTTVFFDDLIFRLPGINLEVAPECSGIHSSLALFITSVLAGRFFLRTPWKSGVLTLAVIPLAILRNGFRIFTIGELCVQISPDMINSYIHRHGGPLFFILSLLPFLILLWFLYKSDYPGQKPRLAKG
jgi:exosortase C (VPDSG-CTERM-specific)